jgi:hypothetical protein
MKNALVLGAFVSLAALCVAAPQPAARPAAPAASAPVPSTDPEMVVRPPIGVDPDIAELPPRNTDPGILETPPVDARASAERAHRPATAASRPLTEPAR